MVPFILALLKNTFLFVSAESLSSSSSSSAAAVSPLVTPGARTSPVPALSKCQPPRSPCSFPGRRAVNGLFCGCLALRCAQPGAGGRALCSPRPSAVRPAAGHGGSCGNSRLARAREGLPPSPPPGPPSWPSDFPRDRERMPCRTARSRGARGAGGTWGPGSVHGALWRAQSLSHGTLRARGGSGLAVRVFILWLRKQVWKNELISQGLRANADVFFSVII